MEKIVKSISVSSLILSLKCLQAWYYKYLDPRTTLKTSYPRLCGMGVHQFVSKLYTPTQDNRPFWYKTKQSALGAWWHKWQRMLEENQTLLILTSKEKNKEYGKIGAFCISNYWNKNITIERPLLTEKYLKTVFKKINIIGVLDQVRKVPLDYIKKFRPNIIHRNELSSAFHPEAIVDLKTGREPFMTVGGQTLREQFKLHNELQATMYTFLYFKQYKKMPIGFFQYFLRPNKYYPTYRTHQDFNNLSQALDNLLIHVERENFPKTVSDNCRWCDYVDFCQGEKSFITTEPQLKLFSSKKTIKHQNKIPPKPPKQMRMKLITKKQSQTP